VSTVTPTVTHYWSNRSILRLLRTASGTFRNSPGELRKWLAIHCTCASFSNRWKTASTQAYCSLPTVRRACEYCARNSAEYVSNDETAAPTMPHFLIV
jgi:hypothetical protein